MAYSGNTQLISGLVRQNGANFKVADAADIYYSDTKSLKEKLDDVDTALADVATVAETKAYLGIA